MKILVGLSGGVDSAVTALLLKEQGHTVIGATMSIWGKDGMALKAGHKNACYGPDEKEDIEEARKIARQLDIPYYVFDCIEEYEKIVLDNFKSEYIQGRTPNPCIWCNALVKFGVLPLLAKQNGIDFDKFATGHYANIQKKDDLYLLKRGIDTKKDQSYFLYRLTQEQLKNIILPLGNYKKEEIRRIAKEHNIKAADKPDSQDFYSGDYNELLGLSEKEGNIINEKGEILGRHKGIWNYTVGQRKGLGISSTEPLYVLKINKDTNEVVVGGLDKTFKRELQAVNINQIIPINNKEMEVQAKIRSTQEPKNALIKINEDNSVNVVFEEYQKSIAIGQSIVFYDNDIVLGGGIIDKIL